MSRYIWNAFLVVQNEENHIQRVIDAIKMQEPSPSRILVANDGSTDSTGEILDAIHGIEVTHYEPHPHDLLSNRVGKLRANLFKEAINESDYVLCVDGDTIIPNSYVNEITKRMRHDGVVIACGQDSQDSFTLVAESPTVIDVRWLKKFQHPTRTSHMNGTVLLIHAFFTGFRSAVYTDIRINYIRRVSANYDKRMIEAQGKSYKRNGFSLWYMILLATKKRKWRYILGYLSSDVECKDSQIVAWNRMYQHERIFGRFSRKKPLLYRTDTALYVEPATTEAHLD